MWAWDKIKEEAKAEPRLFYELAEPSVMLLEKSYHDELKCIYTQSHPDDAEEELARTS